MARKIESRILRRPVDSLDMTFMVIGYTTGRLMLESKSHRGVATYGRIPDTTQKTR